MKKNHFSEVQLPSVRTNLHLNKLSEKWGVFQYKFYILFCKNNIFHKQKTPRTIQFFQEYSIFIVLLHKN